jgi:hypothetical protein
MTQAKSFEEMFKDAKKDPLFWVETILLNIDTYIDECEKKMNKINDKSQLDRIQGVLWVKDKLMNLEKQILDG